MIAGLPGDRQKGNAVIASTLPIANPTTAFDLAPTLCNLFGFPASTEMPGASTEPRIATYGNRAASGQGVKVNEEYYESLKSLGYIR